MQEIIPLPSKPAASAYRILPAADRPLVRLNLGCGLRKLGGFVNIDSNAAFGPEIVRDLRRGLPFGDGTVAEVRAHDVLEHFNGEDLIFLVNECHRVLGPDGLAQFRTPNALSKEHPEWALSDPTHRMYWTVHTWDYWQHDHEQHAFNGRGYGILPWRVQILMLDGDGTIQATCQPVKE